MITIWDMRQWSVVTWSPLLGLVTTGNIVTGSWSQHPLIIKIMAGIWYKSKIEIKERPHSSSGITSFSCLFSDIWDQRWERWMRSLSVSICFWILILISLSHRHNLRSEMFLWSWWWQEQQWMRAGIWWLSILNMSSTLTHSLLRIKYQGLDHLVTVVSVSKYFFVSKTWKLHQINTQTPGSDQILWLWISGTWEKKLIHSSLFAGNNKNITLACKV